MPTYDVTWVQRVEAATPEEAAALARQSLTPEEVEAMWFYVQDRDTGKSSRVFPPGTAFEESK